MRAYVGGSQVDPADYIRVSNGSGGVSLQVADLVSVLLDEGARADLFRLVHHARAGRAGNRPAPQPPSPATVPIVIPRTCETCGGFVGDEAAHTEWHVLLFGLTHPAQVPA